MYPFFHDYGEDVVAQCFLGMKNKLKVQNRYAYNCLDFFSDVGGIYGFTFVFAKVLSSIFADKLQTVMVASQSFKVDPSQDGSPASKQSNKTT